MTTSASEALPEVDLTPFASALSQLNLALAARVTDPDSPFVRDAVIQRFESSYKLAVKTLRRYLRSIAATNDEGDELSFRDLLRRAAAFKLIGRDPLDWLDFRQARTDTVHTYNELRAIEVATAATSFAEAARSLLANLQKRTEA